MTTTQTRSRTDNHSIASISPTTHQARRAVAAVGLGGIALIHALDLPGKIKETPYIGVGYIALIVASLILAETVLRRDDKLVWMAIGGLALAVMAAFVVNRTTGLPGAMDDIGNWLEPLGLASLVVEGMVLLTVVGRFTGKQSTFE
jgi:hypothetical protein